MNTMTYYCLVNTLSVHLKRQRYGQNNLELPTTIMDKSLEFFEDTLRTSIADLSQLIRREALINNPTEHQKALSSIVYFTLLKDELSRLLSAENAVIVTVQRALEGKPFESNDLILSEDSATTAQEYCYSFLPGLIVHSARLVRNLVIGLPATSTNSRVFGTRLLTTSQMYDSY